MEWLELCVSSDILDKSMRAQCGTARFYDFWREKFKSDMD